MEQRMEASMGLSAAALHIGKAGRFMRASRALTVVGAIGTVVIGRRTRGGAALAGAALVLGSVCTRFAVFEAGQASARDPRYTVIPQRERLERGAARSKRPNAT
jgi:hypothetical protein